MARVRIPARPPVRLQYLLWEGTGQVDSRRLAQGLSGAFRWHNLLDDSPAGTDGMTGGGGRPRMFAPCGVNGTDFDMTLWGRGILDFPPMFFDPHHGNAGGDRPDLLAFSGHGVPGYMFAESGVELAAALPIRSSAGAVTRLHAIAWRNPSIRVGLFSSCRQLEGRARQALWARRMRAGPMHMILSYRNTAPAAGTSAGINSTFLAKCRRGTPMVQAWREAHSSPRLRVRWAALCYAGCEENRLDLWSALGRLEPVPADPAGDILYFDEDHPTGRRVTNFAVDPRARLFVPSGGSMVEALPWRFLNPGQDIEVRLARTLPHAPFEPGDEVWLTLMQVRQDYHPPFFIDHVLSLRTPAGATAPPPVDVLGRMHFASIFGAHDVGYRDTFRFVVGPDNAAWHEIEPHGTRIMGLHIPMRVGDFAAPGGPPGSMNDGLRLLYFTVGLRRGGAEIGMHTVVDGGLRVGDWSSETSMHDIAHFAHFWWSPPAP